MKPKIFIGTSGWMYDWNPNGFKWYIRNSKLNAVELNASFYRFPFPAQIESWRRRTPENFRWAIKVNRLITHVYRFKEKALNTWLKFEKLFKPLDNKIDFYLFQLPPNAIPKIEFIERLEKFINEVNLGERFALEWRNVRWINEKWISWCRNLNLTLVSVDSPEMKFYIKTSRSVYLRMHGRTAWYAHNYSESELIEVSREVLKLNPENIYIFFNNNHDMLNNAREMKRILTKVLKQSLNVRTASCPPTEK